MTVQFRPGCLEPGPPRTSGRALSVHGIHVRYVLNIRVSQWVGTEVIASGWA